MKEFILKSNYRSSEIDTKLLRLFIPIIWERNQKTVKSGKQRGKVQRPNGVVHIDANITLTDLEPYLPEAVLSKLKLIYTGPDPLSHPEETELVERMLKNGKALYQVN